MKTNGLILINNKIRRLDDEEMKAALDLVGGIGRFTEASEIGEVYRETTSSGFWYVALAYDLPGAFVITRKDGMQTLLLSNEEALTITNLLGSETFKPAAETGKLFSMPYVVNGTQLGSVQWYPGNDDIPPAK